MPCAVRLHESECDPIQVEGNKCPFIDVTTLLFNKSYIQGLKESYINHSLSQMCPRISDSPRDLELKGD